MASLNPFDLLDNDAEDLTQLVAAKSRKAVKPAPVQPAKPAEGMMDARNAPANGGRGGGRGGGSGRGRGGGYYRDNKNNGAAPANGNGYGGGYYNRRSEEGDGARRGGPVGGYRGGRRGGYSNGESGDYVERPRRNYERHSGTGQGNEFKRDGAGRGNWGTTEDEISPATEESTVLVEKDVAVEKEGGEGETTDAKKETSAEEQVERVPEVKTMTLGEYEKVLEEKKKAMQATKVEERKVDPKAFEAMQQLSSKKSNNDDIFIKLGTEKDKRIPEREEKVKKSLDLKDIRFLRVARYVPRRPEPREPREGSVGGTEHQKAGGAEQQKVGGAEIQKVGGAEQQKVRGAEQQKVGGGEHPRVAGGGEHQRNGGGYQRNGGGYRRNGGAATPAIEDLAQFPSLGK